MSSSKPMAKPLKGFSLNSNFANIGSINASSLKLDNLNVPGLIEDGIFSNIIIEDSELRNTVIGVDGQNSAFFVNLQTTGDVTFLSNIVGASVSWDPDTGLFYITSDLKVNGCSFLGNIEICNNNIKATNLNGDINIIPNGLGTLYLNGPIYNKTTNGSFYSELPKGGVQFNIDNNFTMYASHGSALISTFGDQNMITKNGDIILSVETTQGLSDIISNVNFTDGTMLITTPLNHYLTTGNIVNITNSLISGDFTVGNIINDTQFKLTTTTLSVSTSTGGNYLKYKSNNIILDSKNLIKIPEDTKLTFGETCNSISGISSGLLIKSCNDIYFENPNDKIIQFPKDTKLQLGTSGNNYLNFDGTNININSTNGITLNSSALFLNNINTTLYDPIPLISDFTLTTNDFKDRGISFRYYDNSAGSMKLGWFGYKNNTNLFTFIPDATNVDEIISGTPGNFELQNLSVTNVNMEPGSVIDMNCGNIINANLITGCAETLDIAGSENVNIMATGTISLLGQVFLPTQTKFLIGSQGSLLKETIGNNLILKSTNIYFETQTNGSITIPINTKLSFDGNSIGNTSLFSNTNGELKINANNNIYITTTNGNIIIPENTKIQFGNNTQILSGNTQGITLINNSTSSSLNFISNSSANIYSSFGNIKLFANSGDIELYNASNGNVRINSNKKIIFNSTGTSNNISLTSNNIVLTGNISNTFDINDITNINLNALSNININNGVYLNIGTNRYIYSETNGNLNINNNNSNGQTYFVGGSNTFINNTNGNLLINNLNTTITTNNLEIIGNTTLINTQNTIFKDPILTIGEELNDLKDRGIEYNYNTTLGWFGKKTSTNRFTFFSDAINTNEVITGTIGDLQVHNIYSNGLYVQEIDMSCGSINNVNILSGCTGIININATSGINQNSNNIFLNATNKIEIPLNVPIIFGNTSNSLMYDTIGNLIIKTVLGSKIIFDSNIQVNGTTTNVYSTVTNISDPIFSIGGITGPIVDDNKDRGIEFKWNDSVNTKTGFFGFKDSTNRFVFIKDGINTNEVFSGDYSDIQIANSFIENITLNNFGSGGNIYGINTLSGGEITIKSTSGNIYITPTQGSNILLPYNTILAFGNTSNGIQTDTSGNLIINSYTAEFTTNTLDLNIQDINIPQSTIINIGNSFITENSNGNLNIINTQGNIYLTPEYSSGSIYIPTYNNINFGNTANSIYSNGTNLILTGYEGIDFNSTSVTFNGDVNIIGSISATGIEFDFNKYILPLGTYQYLVITDISNISGTNGNVQITVSTPHNFIIGDTLTIKNSNAVPDIDAEDYIITYIDTLNIFRIEVPFVIFTTNGNSGTVKSNLTTQQNKDVGIQVNYWSSSGNIGLTSGTLGYKTGFFGFKNDTYRWSFYSNSTIASDIVSGSFGDIQVNKVFTDKMSGFTLEGTLSGGSNIISGTNFQINGGSINSTPIGAISAQSGRFSTLNNTVTASLTDTTLQGTLIYPLTDKYILSSGGITFRSPSSSVLVSMFSVSGVNFTTPSGTMPTLAIAEGTIKWLICNGMDTGCRYTVFFGSGKLIAPNPLNDSYLPTKLIFKRKGQSAQLIYDGTAWVMMQSGVYVE